MEATLIKKSVPWGFLPVYLFLSIISSAAPAAFYYVFGLYWNTLNGSDPQASTIFYLPILASIAVGNIGVLSLNCKLTQHVADVTKRRIQREFLRYLLEQSPMFYEKNSPGAVVAKFEKDVGAVHSFLKESVSHVIESGLELIAFAVMLFTLPGNSWRFGLVVVCGAIGTFAVSIVGSLGFQRHWRDIQKASEQSGNFLSEVVTAYKEIYYFQAASYFLEKFHSGVSLATFRTQKKLTHHLILNIILIRAVFSGSLLVTAYVGYNEVVTYGASFGTLLTFWATAQNVLGVTQHLAHKVLDTIKFRVSLSNLFNFELEPNEMIQTTELDQEPNDWKLSIKNVHFQYPLGKKYVLRGISVDIEQGSFVGVVGTSGSGKSTFLALISRLYCASKGTITLGGHDISSLPASYTLRQISFVPQDSILFTGTIEENIRCGDLKSSFEEVTKAAQLARIHEAIIELPEGYKTIVSGKGTTLSGGQRQRIAIARALVRYPKILIFDEATSSLDANTEKEFEHTIEAMIADGKTVIYVAHKLKLLEKAHKIIVLSQGIVAEEGSFQDLLENNGLFAMLYNNQKLSSQLPNADMQRRTTM